MILEIKAQKKFLAVPVYTSDVKEDLQDLKIFVSEKQIYDFRIPYIRKKKPDYFAYLPIDAFLGETLLIEADLGEEYFNEIHQSDAEDLPKEKRPEFHYTAPYGWINDPNGMVYHNGVYHLYYQHNPMNTEWENISWGHCISKDLIHFEYVSDVMFPDENGTMFSGCGLVNERGCFGLPKDALLFFYTAAGSANAMSRGREFTQRLAYSLDGGQTLVKHDGFCMECMESQNRDPKVFWHEESRAYIMSLFLSENRFAIFRSEDLRQWVRTDTLSYPPMWECPDLFALKSESGEVKWAFMSADGYYFIGEFDGYTFQRESEMQAMYRGGLPYAAQSFSGTGDRVISIAWLRTADKGKKYSGMMSIAREFRLGKDESGYYIHQSFVKEMNEQIQYKNNMFIVEDDGIIESISADGRFCEVILS